MTLYFFYQDKKYPIGQQYLPSRVLRVLTIYYRVETGLCATMAFILGVNELWGFIILPIIVAIYSTWRAYECGEVLELTLEYEKELHDSV